MKRNILLALYLGCVFFLQAKLPSFEFNFLTLDGEKVSTDRGRIEIRKINTPRGLK